MGRLDTCKKLISLHADPKLTVKSHATVLHLASANGHDECVQYFIQQGTIDNIEMVISNQRYL